MKSYVFIQEHAPSLPLLDKEWLELCLATAALVPTVALVFLGDGILHLVKASEQTPTQSSEQGPIAQAQAEYEIPPCYVDAQSMQRHSLLTSDLCVDVTVLDALSLHDFIKQHDVILASNRR